GILTRKIPSPKPPLRADRRIHRNPHSPSRLSSSSHFTLSSEPGAQAVSSSSSSSVFRGSGVENMQLLLVTRVQTW
ncbi:hypothetical protein LINPERHAP2_LOCUS527, partial [Linum perenne]